MPERFLITDFRDPVLTDDQRRLMREAEQNPVELTEEAVLAAAVERARLDDFGREDFRERLGLIVDEVSSDENATELVRTTFFNRLVQVLTNRLLRQNVLQRHPEVEEDKIERPIIIAGLPRSGTTHLLGLLAADRRLRSLPYWESLQPIPLGWEEVGPDGVDPRYIRSEQGWERVQRINPMMAPYHPMDPDHIHEDLELQTPDIASYAWEWMYRMPRWRDYYLAHDQTPHYEFARTTLKVMSWQDGRLRRWVLKCPQHFEQLGPIMAVYPDALLVFMHRDPIASLQSIVTPRAYVIRTQERRVDPDWYLEYWCERVRGLLQAYVRDMALVPEEQRVDVIFDELIADNMATVERVYRAAGLDLAEGARADVESYLVNHPRGKYGTIDHDLRRDFSVDPNKLREQFAFYLDRVPVRAEAK
jgi:hypothetical protein